MRVQGPIIDVIKSAQKNWGTPPRAGTYSIDYTQWLVCDYNVTVVFADLKASGGCCLAANTLEYTAFN